MPTLGFGVAETSDCVFACLAALKSGYKCAAFTCTMCVHRYADTLYRHIDTARYYKNEEQVGQAIRQSGIPRKEVFVSEHRTERSCSVIRVEHEV